MTNWPTVETKSWKPLILERDPEFLPLQIDYLSSHQRLRQVNPDTYFQELAPTSTFIISVHHLKQTHRRANVGAHL
jgi:hypothetical protein